MTVLYMSARLVNPDAEQVVVDHLKTQHTRGLSVLAEFAIEQAELAAFDFGIVAATVCVSSKKRQIAVIWYFASSKRLRAKRWASASTFFCKNRSAR